MDLDELMWLPLDGAVTASELATWFGLFLGSTQFADSGDRFWKPKFQTFVDSGFKDVISLKRFKDIRKYISFTIQSLMPTTPTTGGGLGVALNFSTPSAAS